MSTTRLYYDLLYDAKDRSRACQFRPGTTERVLQCALRVWPYSDPKTNFRVSQDAICESVKAEYKRTYGSIWVALLWVIIKVIVAMLVDWWVHSDVLQRGDLLKLQVKMLRQ